MVRICMLWFSLIIVSGLWAQEVPNGPFMGIQPTTKPKLLFPGFISTSMGEYNGTFTPEGDVFCYTVSVPRFGGIVFSHLQADGSWSMPTIASFSGKYQDFDPVFSPDGKQLYFSSNRPTPSDTKRQSRIWVVDRQGTGWGKPRHIPIKVDAPVYYNSVAADGTLYVNTTISESMAADLFRLEPGGDGRLINLGDQINSKKGEWDPFIAPDESFLIFRSYREDSLGRGDLYISFQVDGQWQAPTNLGPTINSAEEEWCPWVSQDGKFLIFASNRQQQTYEALNTRNPQNLLTKLKTHDNGWLNIYVVGTDFLKTLRPKP